MEVVLPGYDAWAHLVIAHLQGYGWKDTWLIEARYFFVVTLKTALASLVFLSDSLIVYEMY